MGTVTMMVVKATVLMSTASTTLLLAFAYSDTNENQPCHSNNFYLTRPHLLLPPKSVRKERKIRHGKIGAKVILEGFFIWSLSKAAGEKCGSGNKH